MITSIFYIDIKLIVSSIVLIMGLILVFGPFPTKLRNSAFNSARINIGCAYIIIPVITYFLRFTGIYDSNHFITSAIKLTGYYWTASMVVYTFHKILGFSAKLSEPIVVRGLIYCFIYPLIMFIALFVCGDNYANKVLVVGAVGLIIHNIWRVAQLIRRYRRSQIKVNNYFSDDFESHYHWMINSVYFIIILCCLSVVIPFLQTETIWCGLIFMAFCIWTYGYVFYNFTKFIFVSIVESNILEADISQVLSNDAQEKVVLSTELKKCINKNINEWVDTKEFIHKGITIQTVASQVYTNRTYLSLYINSTYNCSFRVWISRLRIEEAKKILFLQPDSNIDDIANDVGFASTSSFIHTFKLNEGLPPHQWRKMRLEH